MNNGLDTRSSALPCWAAGQKFIDKVSALSIDHASDGWPGIKMQELNEAAKAITEMISSYNNLAEAANDVCSNHYYGTDFTRRNPNKDICHLSILSGLPKAEEIGRQSTESSC